MFISTGPYLCSPCSTPSPGTVFPLPSPLLFLSVQALLPHPGTSIPSSSLLPYQGAAPASPWLLIRPRFYSSPFCPFLQPNIFISHPHKGFCPGAGPPLCFQSSLCPSLGAAAAAAKSVMWKGSWRNLAPLPDQAAGVFMDLDLPGVGNGGGFTAM